MKNLCTFIFSSSKPILYFIITIVGIIGVFILLTGGKANVETSKTSSDELSFLDANLYQINIEAGLSFEKKNYRAAARNYIVILHHKPSDIPTLYNLARCYAHLKKPELAAKTLLHALDAGLNDIPSLLSDSAWIPIRNHETFKPFLEKATTLQKERGESFFAECKIIIKGWIRQPDNYDSTKAYPLLILLHGNGGNAESYMVVRDMMGATNFFVAAPQGPYPRKKLEGNSPSYSWFYLTQNKELWKKADPMVVNYILSAINEIKGHHKISKVFILGHSQGGALAYMTGVNNPDIINGIICYGAANPKEFLSNANLRNASSKLPIFISHGWSDPSIKFNEAQQTKSLFKEFGFNVTFKPFDGGHWLDTQTLTEAKKWIDDMEKK